MGHMDRTSPRRRYVSLALPLALALTFGSLVTSGSTEAMARGGKSQGTHPARSTIRPPAFGAFVDGMQQDPSVLGKFERIVSTDVSIASYYYGFGDVFPGQLERTFAQGGKRKVLLSWDMGATRFTEWTTGQHDDYLAQIATAAEAYPYPLYVRPWPEMNGDWQTFQPTASGKRPNGGTYREFIAAWRHVVRHTRSLGATNIRWVFNPAADTYPETTPVNKIWPGARYVDVLGIDGFNWGRDSNWGRWQSFARIMGPMYRRLTALHPTAPVWICEFGSKEPRTADGAPVDPAHNKASWLRRAFSYQGMPRVKAMIYFHARKERDWRVNSSRGARHAVRSALGNR